MAECWCYQIGIFVLPSDDLQVPYDCGLFFTRSPSALTDIFAPPLASAPAYLASGSNDALHSDRAEGEIIHELVPNPLYVGIDNSRRFRAP